MSIAGTAVVCDRTRGCLCSAASIAGGLGAAGAVENRFAAVDVTAPDEDRN
jgi:hypothetical protein